MHIFTDVHRYNTRRVTIVILLNTNPDKTGCLNWMASKTPPMLPPMSGTDYHRGYTLKKLNSIYSENIRKLGCQSVCLCFAGSVTYEVEYVFTGIRVWKYSASVYIGSGIHPDLKRMSKTNYGGFTTTSDRATQYDYCANWLGAPDKLWLQIQ